MIFWCQSCGEQHTMPHVTSANITTCAKCGGQHFATWQPVRKREPATEAVLADTEKMLLTRQSWLDEGRREGLEEAAVVCDAYKEELLRAASAAPNGFALVGYRQLTAEYLAAAVRALKGKGASQGDSPEDRETMRRDFERSIYEREGRDEDAKR